jgi:hypothetical protein
MSARTESACEAEAAYHNPAPGFGGGPPGGAGGRIH